MPNDSKVGGLPEQEAQPILAPTQDELIALGEAAVDGYLDLEAAKSWFTKWLLGRVGGVLEP